MFGRKKTKAHILLVDSFVQIREVTQSILESGGYTVTAVGDVSEALKSLGKKRPDFIISEVELSDTGGIGFYHRIRKHPETQQIPFIFMTSYDKNKLLKELRPGDLLIPKPVKWKELLQQIETFWAQHSQSEADPQQSAKPEHTTPVATTPKHSVRNTPLSPPATTSAAGTAKVTAAAAPLPKTTARAMPQRLEIKPEAGQRKNVKKRKLPMVILPEGRATHHFTQGPIGIFNFRQIKDTFALVLKAFKTGKSSSLEPIALPNLGTDWVNNLEQALLQQSQYEYTRPLQEFEQEIILDLDVEDARNEPTSVIEVDHEVAALADETTQEKAVEQVEQATVAELPLQPIEPMPYKFREQFQKLAREHPISSTDHYFWLQAGEAFVNHMDIEFSEEQAQELCTAIFSMAGLCFQIFEEDFAVAHVMVETEQNRILLVQNENESSYGLAMSSPTGAGTSIL